MTTEMDIMKEEAAFEMQGSSYDGDGELVEVSYSDLRTANIGDMWEARDTHNCGRALDEESAEVVYKTERGAAVLFRSSSGTSSREEGQE